MKPARFVSNQFTLTRQIFVATALVTSSALAQFNAGEPSQPETNAMEKVIEQYLLKNPEIIQRSMALQQERAQKAEAERMAKAVGAKQKELYEDASDMVLGNPKGDVTVVEFFDFRCGYCKRAHGTIKELLATDSNLRIVLKQLPILGPDSLRATQAALAANKQGKYAEFHSKLFDLQNIDAASINATAVSMGLDIAKLERDVQDQGTWAAAVTKDSQLASELGINGTPAFVIENTLIPGAIDADNLRAVVKAVRAAKATTASAPSVSTVK
jgi:protein-disulfide isomerase